MQTLQQDQVYVARVPAWKPRFSRIELSAGSQVGKGGCSAIKRRDARWKLCGKT